MLHSLWWVHRRSVLLLPIFLLTQRNRNNSQKWGKPPKHIACFSQRAFHTFQTFPGNEVCHVTIGIFIIKTTNEFDEWYCRGSMMTDFILDTKLHGKDSDSPPPPQWTQKVIYALSGKTLLKMQKKPMVQKAELQDLLNGSKQNKNRGRSGQIIAGSTPPFEPQAPFPGRGKPNDHE